MPGIEGDLVDLTEHVEPLLDRYRTGELPDSERERVVSHLDTCEACAAALTELEAFSGAVGRGFAASRELAGAEPDWAALRQAIVARTSAPPGRRGWFAAHVPQLAAAAVALLAIGVVLQQGIRGPDDVERALEPAVSGESSIARSGSRESAQTETAGDDVDEGDNRARSQVDAIDREPRSKNPTFGDEVEVGADAEARAMAPPMLEDAPSEDAIVDRRANERQAALEAEAPGAANAQEETEGFLRDGEYDQDKVEAAKQHAARPDAEALRADASRFEAKADFALANRDTVAAREALSFYRDSLALGRDLDPTSRDIAQALADSLAALLAAQP